jgi:hypothetical protein
VAGNGCSGIPRPLDSSSDEELHVEGGCLVPCCWIVRARLRVSSSRRRRGESWMGSSSRAANQSFCSLAASVLAVGVVVLHSMVRALWRNGDRISPDGDAPADGGWPDRDPDRLDVAPGFGVCGNARQRACPCEPRCLACAHGTACLLGMAMT